MNSSYIKATLLSVCLTGIFFSLITLLLAALGILNYSPLLLNSLAIAGIPLKILQLPFIIPVIALGLYQFLNSRFPGNALEKYSLLFSNILLGICVALLFFGYQKWYTLITTLILFTLLLYIEYLNRIRFMYYFYRLFILLAIPFYLFCIAIMKRNMLKFDVNATLKLKLGSVSIESFFYLMAMLLMVVYLFEFFKNKMANIDG